MDANEHCRRRSDENASDAASSPTIGCRPPTAITVNATILSPTTSSNATIRTTICIPVDSPIQHHSINPKQLPNAGSSARHSSSPHSTDTTTLRLRPKTIASPSTGFANRTNSSATDAADGTEHPDTNSSVCFPNTSNWCVQSKPTAGSIYTIAAGGRLYLCTDTRSDHGTARCPSARHVAGECVSSERTIAVCRSNCTTSSTCSTSRAAVSHSSTATTDSGSSSSSSAPTSHRLATTSAHRRHSVDVEHLTGWLVLNNSKIQRRRSTIRRRVVAQCVHCCHSSPHCTNSHVRQTGIHSGSGIENREGLGYRPS